MLVLLNTILIIAVFLIEDIAIVESASASKRVVYQTFFDNNLFLTCYGTCSHSVNGFSSAMRNFRCEGTKVRLKCHRGYVISVSFAFYGELEAGQEVCKDVSSLLEQCRKDVSEIVGKDCDGKGLCLFTVDNHRFGKFCEGQYFYLDIRHSCEARPSTNENTDSSTTTKDYTTKQVQTTQRSTKLKPITIYKDGRSSSSTSSVGRNGGDPTTHDSTDRQGSSSHTTDSNSSPVAATTHMPISGSGTSTKNTKGKGIIDVPKLVTLSPTELSRSSGKKASLYWLLTAHSLVTDKGFIKANSTHLILAIILSIFIALVISICFLLDHSRRQALKNSRKQLREDCGTIEEAAPLENGSPVGYDLHQEPSRPKSSSNTNPLLINGSAKRLSTHSLNDFNPNIDNGSEIFPLLPIIAPSLTSINHECTKEQSHICDSSIIDHLPPPPEDLLLDSPRQSAIGYLDDNESETSTVSIPPPVGFTDADVFTKSTSIIKTELQIKSPSHESRLLAGTCAALPSNCNSLRSLPKIDNSKRLNNEFCPEISTVSHDNNLLLNSVSVQTNDLKETSDKKSRADNAGHVSMRSPNFEISDIYATTDDISNITAIDPEELKNSKWYDVRKMPLKDATHEGIANEKYNNFLREKVLEMETIDLRNGAVRALECKNDRVQNAKRGKLVVLNSPDENSTEPESGGVELDISQSKCHLTGKSDRNKKDKLSTEVSPTENIVHSNTGANAVISNGSIRTKWNGSKKLDDVTVKTDEKEEYAACTSSFESDSALQPTYDGISKQVFAVPKHRCGMGHNHKCACIPLRTGSSSFICSCLENAKYKSSRCCMEKCPDEPRSIGLPYSSQRSSNWRGLATELPRRKKYIPSGIKRASSLEHIEQNPDKFANFRKDCTYDSKDPACNDKIEKTSRFTAPRSNTLPNLQSKLKKNRAGNSGSRTLDRVHWASGTSSRQDAKLMPVIVHTTRNRQVPRFEKSTDRLDDKVKSSNQNDSFQINRSEDSDSSDRSGSTEGHSISLPTTPIEMRRKRNGHHRLSPISENTSKKSSTQEHKSWPKRSPRFRIQVVESIHYDKKKRANEV